MFKTLLQQTQESSEVLVQKIADISEKIKQTGSLVELKQYHNELQGIQSELRANVRMEMALEEEF